MLTFLSLMFSWLLNPIKQIGERAALQVGNRVLNIAPSWLIFVGGLFYQTDFTGVALFPINFKVPNKLVYTGHIYQNSIPSQVFDYEEFKIVLNKTQTFVRRNHPFLFGEFEVGDVNINYWQWLMRFLK